MSIGFKETGLGPSPPSPPIAHLLELPDRLLDLLPAAVYVCDAGGFIVRYNRRAAELWGREPRIGDPAERFCGSHRLYRLDGGPLPHAECPMADTLQTGIAVRNQDVVIERPDGSRVVASVNIDALRDDTGAIVGALNCFHDITERKRAEDEARTSRRDLEDFFENAVIPMHLVGPDGTILRANRAELALLGYAREEYVGRNIVEFHADRAAIDGVLASLMRGEILDGYPARLRAKDGTVKYVLISSSVLFEKGEPVHTRCVSLDMTAFQRADEARREQERQYKSLLDALPVAVYTTDPQGRITYYNEAAVELSGRRPELGSDKWCVTWRLYRPDGTPLPHDECPMAIALKEQRPVRGVEAIAERPDGTRVPFIPYPMPIFDSAGVMTGAVNTLVDISEPRRAEQASQRLSLIVESSDDAIVSKDLNGIVASWNRGAERIFGYTAEEVVGKPITILIPDDRQHEEEMVLGRIRRGERIDHYETVRRRKDGSLIEISLSVSPVRDAEGRIVGASKIARDITERRRAEEQQNLLIREMSHRVKNLFAVTGSVVALSARSARTPQEMADALHSRLRALTDAHELTRPGLIGQDAKIGQDTTLHALLRAILAPYADPGGPESEARLVVSGRDVPLGQGVVTSVALLLHELATNAVKYGALVSPTGRISIDCAVEREELQVVWTERGGPPIDGQPGAEGFGGLLAERLVKGQFAGQLSREWGAEGLIIRLSIPLQRLAQ